MELDLTTPEGRKKQGELILRAIREAGLSVEQVARDIGCSRALLYQYIAGTTLAQPDKLTLIAKRTGKPLAFFFGADLEATSALAVERAKLARERAELERQQTAELGRRLRERLDALFALAEAQSTPPDWKAAASTYEQILPLAREIGDLQAEATALFRLGNLRLLMGELESAITVLRQAQMLFEQQSNLPYALACRQSIGRALLLMGRPEEAQQQFAIALQQGNWHNRWEATVALAAVAEWMGDFQKAMAHLDQAEEMATAAPTEHDRKTVLLFVAANRANVYLACGDFEEAEKLARAALHLSEQLGDRDQQLEALLTIAVCQRFQGKWVEAYENALRARTLALFANDTERVAVAETVLAQIALVTGDFAAAKQWAKNALTTALKVRSRRAELWAHKALAETYLREENVDDADYHAKAAIEIAESINHALELSHTLCLMAWSKWKGGEQDSAFQTVKRAFALADEKGMRHIAALAAWLSAQIAQEHQPEEAAQWLTQAEALAREVGDADLLACCLAVKGNSVLNADESTAEQALTEFHRLVERWRTEWRNAGYDDTWLEDPLRVRAYLALATLIARKQGTKAAETFLDEQGWLPLKEAWEQAKQER